MENQNVGGDLREQQNQGENKKVSGVKGLDNQYWALLSEIQQEGTDELDQPFEKQATLFTIPVKRELSSHSILSPPIVKWDFVIFPDNKWALRWDLWILTLIVFTVFEVPFQIGVSAGALAYTFGWWFLFFAFINWCFIADTILNFFRASFDRNMNMVISLKRIRQNYLRGWFVIDLLSCFPTDVIIRFAENETVVSVLQLLNMLRIFRVFRLNRIIHNSHSLLLWRLRYPEWKIAAIKLILYLLVFNHWVACSLSWLALIQAGSFDEDDLYNPETPNWMQTYHNAVETFVYPTVNNTFTVAGNHIDNIFASYILSLYWSVITTTSIGYGDITASTFAEYWVVTAVCLLSGCFWAFFLARAIDVADKASEELQGYWARLNMANNLVRKFDDKDSFDSTKYGHKHGANFKSIVERELVLFVYRQHYLGLSSNPQVPVKEMSDIMAHLPRFLRDRVCLALIQKDLYKLSWFRHPSIGLDTLAGVASLCEIHQFGPRERVHFSRDSVKRGIYIMRRGIIAYKEKNGSKTIDRVYCSTGVLFKEFAVFKTGDAFIPPITLSMLTWTEMIFVPRKAVKVLFQVHPEVWKDNGRWCMLHGVLKYWARRNIRSDTNGVMLLFEEVESNSFDCS